jgi:hypothetical protein
MSNLILLTDDQKEWLENKMRFMLNNEIKPKLLKQNIVIGVANLKIPDCIDLETVIQILDALKKDVREEICVKLKVSDNTVKCYRNQLQQDIEDIGWIKGINQARRIIEEYGEKDEKNG